jgi:hypothetical protein
MRASVLMFLLLAGPVLAQMTAQTTAGAPVPVLGQPSTIPHAPTAAVLDLPGDDQSLATDCTGRDVTIHGTRSLYVLRGGCRSLTVDGGLDVVQAEMQPRAKIMVDGDGIIVSWALLDHGPQPLAIAHGEANHIQRTETIGGQPIR